MWMMLVHSWTAPPSSLQGNEANHEHFHSLCTNTVLKCVICALCACLYLLYIENCTCVTDTVCNVVTLQYKTPLCLTVSLYL